MSGFVETLVTSKVHPLTKKEEEDYEDQKKINKDVEIGESKGAKKQLEDKNNVELKPNQTLGLCPLVCPLGQPHKDKGGKSTPRRKHRVLERLNTRDLEGKREPDVQMERLSIVCRGRPEIALSHPFISSPKACLFTLKEGTRYKLKFSFVVSNDIVSGLKYENTLWKAGIRIDKSTAVLGTFRPQEKPHVFELEEETLPCGILVRGLYSARAKVIDDNGKCYMDLHYHFDIQKNWPSNS